MDSAYLKLARARLHVDALRASMANYRASGAISFRIRQTVDPHDSLVTVADYVACVDSEPPASKWGDDR